MSIGTFQKLRPLSLLTHLVSCYDSAYLKVFSNSVSWSIHLNQGKIVYASHSVEPFDRLDCHLRRLSHQIPTIASEARNELRLMLEEAEIQSNQNLDYQAICWLVEQQYLDFTQAALLIEGLVKEVIESFLLVKAGTYELRVESDITPFCKLDLQPIVEHCQKQLQGWKQLGPQISSPYQRPYFLDRNGNNQQISPEIKQKLSAMLKGFSFRHLAILLNQDELQLVRSLHPYVVSGTILLQEPYPPFDQLPKTFDQSLDSGPLDNNVSITQQGRSQGYKPEVPNRHINIYKEADFSGKASSTQLPDIPARPPENISLNNKGQGTATSPTLNINNTPAGTKGFSNGNVASATKNIYKIVCVDDSQAMLNQIGYFLDDESFSVVTISDPVKALMQIVRLKPDMILLDVNMAGINGYELCRLLRNHTLFKSKPIIMITGNTGVIDRVKARLVGASGYLTKPFAQSDLLKIIFRHLS